MDAETDAKIVAKWLQERSKDFVSSDQFIKGLRT